MNSGILVVGSITYALKAQQILNSYGISCYIERNEELKARYGCGYALKIKRSFSQAVELCRKNQIKILAVLDGDSR